EYIAAVARAEKAEAEVKRLRGERDRGWHNHGLPDGQTSHDHTMMPYDEVKRLRKALGQIAAQAVSRGMENPWNISARRIARTALEEA
ncbi:MAG: hypothetical protein ACREI2_14790, partial [Nitrospiraceae bacterium]